MRFSVKIIAIILFLLAVIISSGIFMTNALSKSSKELGKKITEIEKYIQSEDWNKAMETLNSLKKDWEKTKSTWSMLIDHIEVDNIETSLTRVSKYVELRHAAYAMTEISVLKQYIDHIPEKESFTLENIF
ncbi:MAG TPA: DUF4363 family protein [Clostridiaceae bacterium]|nr:DUF4363 family protein [Clostridiaceae bacterium]